MKDLLAGIPQVGTILLLLFLTVCVIESANRYFTSMIHSGQIAELFSGSKDLSKKICVSGRMILFGFTALFLFCLATQTSPDFSRTSAAALKSMAAGLTHPDWSFFFSTEKDGLGYLLLETICIAIVGTAIGAFPCRTPCLSQHKTLCSLLRPLFSLT